MMRGLYVILDEASLGTRDPVIVARAALRGGAKTIQYRAKGVGDAQLFKLCQRLQRLCAKSGAAFIVNDRCDVALAVGAAGVHLGDEDLPLSAARKILGAKKLIGVSSHSVGQALRLAQARPDYLAVGPVFESSTKVTGRKLLGTETIRRIAGKVSCPVVAIGGINRHNAAAVMEAGASAVAVIAAVSRVKNPGKAVREIVQILRCAQNDREGTEQI